MLGDAAAAGPEVTAARLPALGAGRGQKFGQSLTVEADALARQREGNEARAVRRLRDAVALRPEPAISTSPV